MSPSMSSPSSLSCKFRFSILLGLGLVCVFVACTLKPEPRAAQLPTPPSFSTPHQVINVPTPTATATLTVTPEPDPTPSSESSVSQKPTFTPTPTPVPISAFQHYVTRLADLSRLPVMENTITTQFTSRNWVSLEHYFDWFIDDGNFTGPHYGYIDEKGMRQSYRMVKGYDGRTEYEIVPYTPGPGLVTRIWFAHQQHQSINNPADMSRDPEWTNWGNLGQVGNIRFYFDDEAVPRLDFNIKDLFVGKPPFPAPLAAFYASANGGNINYVPIPFQKSIRVTTTGRPRMMQIQVKRFVTDPSAIPENATTSERVSRTSRMYSRVLYESQDESIPLVSSPTMTFQSFAPELNRQEQAVLDQAVQAWQTCTPLALPDFTSFDLTIPHNKSAEIVLNQPATIAGLRVHVPRGMDDSVWMQVFWDGEVHPSMSAPLRAMFSTDRQLLPYRALPVGFLDSLSEHLFYIYFPMPFRSARLVFLNDRAETLPLRVDLALRETLPGTEGARLHVFYGTRRMVAREDDNDNYVAIDVQGRGKYLGMILNAWDLDRRALNGPLDEHWRFPYLESNVDVWIDSRLALPGTGIEDDFNASYYYVFAGYEGYNTKYCLAGLTLLDYRSPREPSSQYRFYLNDAPEFQRHLRVQVQHGNKGNNLAVTYSSTVFWYQWR